MRTATAGARFISPEALARIDTLELVARGVVDGFINGLHRSPFLGFSTDFAEHREYMPGDDIRRIDWKLFARTDRFYLKQFEAETNTNFMAILDVSNSMSFGSGVVNKLDYGRFLAASLTYFSSRQRDRVGLVTYDADVLKYVPPSAKHLDVALHTLDGVKPAPRGTRPDETDVSGVRETLTKVSGLLRRKGIAVVISDFYEDPDHVVDALNQLRFAGQDVVAFHVLDPVEIDFPFEQASSFEDLETGERVPVIPDRLRERYHALMTDHGETLSRRLSENRIDYVRAVTSEPLDETLFTYLAARVRMARTR